MHHPQHIPSDVRSLRASLPRGGRRGTTALELVCVLPVLIGLVLGATDFGRFAQFTNVLSNSARVGAEYGATHRRTVLNAATWEQRIIDAVTAEAAHLPDFDADRLVVNVNTSQDDGLLLVEVEAVYPFETIVDWPGLPGQTELRERVSYLEYR